MAPEAATMKYQLLAAMLAAAALMAVAGATGANVIVTSSNAISSVAIAPTSNSFISGNSQTWLGTVTGGTEPYSYTWNVYSGTGTLLSTTTYTGNAYTTNAYTYLFSSTGYYYANVVVIDTNAKEANSVNSLITVCWPTCTGTPSASAYISLPPPRIMVEMEGWWQQLLQWLGL